MNALRKLSCCLIVLVAGGVSTNVSPLMAEDASDWLNAFESLDGSSNSDQQAIKAAAKLQSLPSDQIAQVLAGFAKADQRGKNWLRSIASDVADNGAFPKDALETFFANRENDADARYVAFQLLTQQDAAAKERLLAFAETDPSLPVRFLKIKTLLEDASETKSDSPEKAIATLQQVIANGRSPSQLEKAADMLADLGQEVDLAGELGMVRAWWLLGPFDNTESQHFDTVYLPETAYVQSGSPIVVDAAGDRETASGKNGNVIGWQRIKTDDELGMVDLNAPLSNEKDAAAYVFQTFRTSGAYSGPAQARLGCITANKVWVNGELVVSNEVYHSGSRIDQYIGDCELVDGENSVMIKVMQNAQTQPWAQDWQFQFRLTRPDGSAIKTQP